MLNFFRRIRRQLADKNQFMKYSRYAVGEILLVMVGILLALQVNNWNEGRKQDARFAVAMEQLYNTLTADVEYYDNHIRLNDNHITTIDYLLDSLTQVQKMHLPYILHSLSIVDIDFKSETSYHINSLEYSQDNKLQNDITKQMISYSNIDRINDPLRTNIDRYLDAVRKINLAAPKVDHERAIDGWVTSDSTYYSEKDLENSFELTRSEAFRAILKSLRTSFVYQHARARSLHSDGLSLLRLIKKHYPDVKLLFMDVGVKGTAIDGFDNVYGPSSPMTLTDIENEIWEIDIYLLEGRIKFRCRDSWAVNWGADAFPRGTGFQDGPDIIVPEEGMYHIVFKPVTGEYEFTLSKQN